VRAMIALGLLLAACAPSTGAAGPSVAAAPSAVQRGQALFLNKGCITCHQNAALGYEGTIIGVGPDLTTYRGDEQFLLTWLKDPSALRPATQMPNLQLRETEIRDLIAFLNRER
jgi:mono/diheme cytochrome c family protein